MHSATSAADDFFENTVVKEEMMMINFSFCSFATIFSTVFNITFPNKKKSLADDFENI